MSESTLHSSGPAAAHRGSSEVSSVITVAVAARDEGLVAKLFASIAGDGFEIVAHAQDARAAVREAIEHNPQICLLDAELPGGTLGAVTAIVAHLPETRVAMFADSPSNGRALRAVQAGAEGILIVSDPVEQLRHDVELLARGELPLPEDAARVATTDVAEPEMLPERPNGSRIGWVLLYLPRFMRHLWRRRRAGMSLRQSWASARDRVNEY